jgi:hypothetical protein
VRTLWFVLTLIAVAAVVGVAWYYGLSVTAPLAAPHSPPQIEER